MRPAGDVLHREDYEVQTVPLATARELVEAHHYARGGANTATFRHGLFRRGSPDECLGVAWWIPPTRAAAETVHDDWRGVLALTRLVIVPGTPTNSASFLLSASVKLIRKDARWKALVTYADEGQGHTGAIYRAANWRYVGIRPGDPVYLDGNERQMSRKVGPKTRTNAEMLALGYVNTGRTRKHKFSLSLEGPQS